MLCGTTASGAVQEGEVTTTIRSGEVRIRMHRYGDEKKEKGWEDLEHILPGQKITMITEIENLGENCLIRYQMTAEAKSNREIPISSFSGIPGNCVRKGEYFYHTDVVKHGETVRLFTAFTLPETWEQGGEDEIRIHVAADAIQSRNFTPDFTSEHPWGDQVIQKVSGKTGDQLRILTPRKGTCRVVLEGDDIITVPDTFFAEFGTLVPGDVIQGELQIDNRSGRPEDVYWKLETEEELLLEQAELWVEKEDGTVLCQGSPSEQSLGQFAFLETYEQNEKENLIFFLRFPEDMSAGVHTYLDVSGSVRGYYGSGRTGVGQNRGEQSCNSLWMYGRRRLTDRYPSDKKAETTAWINGFEELIRCSFWARFPLCCFL